MTRVLKRPMFRLGGPANEGITSGLAPRQGYQNQGSVQPMSEYEKELLERARSVQTVKDKLVPTRGRGDLSQFLIDFGLETASATPSGSIFSTAAASAKDPYARYTAKKAARLSDEDKFTTSMLGDIAEQMSEEQQQRIEGQATGKKQYEYRGKYDDYTELLAEQRQLEEKLRKAQEVPEGVPPGPGGMPNQETIRIIKEQMEDNKKQQLLFADEQKDYILEKLIRDQMVTAEEVEEYIRTKKETGVGTMPESNATGGRVGYATAGQVVPGEMPRTSQADTIQSMSFEDLRSRLPSTITNDVIQLLAKSQEALVEFSNIQTESDIRSFNRKYEVNLVLPPEA